LSSAPSHPRRRAGLLDIVFVCTANQCRSPIAEVLMRHRLEELHIRATVTSAGLLRPGAPPPSTGITLMALRGMDISEHHSRRLSDAVVHHTDLLLGLGTRHVREVVSSYPHAWPKSFVLKDFVQRASAVGPRRHGENLRRLADPDRRWPQALHEPFRRPVPADAQNRSN
jgi:protein-tyrosine-phosphatase